MKGNPIIDGTPFDLFEQERRKAWDRYAANCPEAVISVLLDGVNYSSQQREAAQIVARYADLLLAERDKRFPKGGEK